MKNKPLLVILSGNSGAGKTTTMRDIVKNSKGSDAEKIFEREIKSTTTREPREGEVNGVDYNFVTREVFLNSPTIESAEYLGNFYGITEEEFNKKLVEKGASVIVEAEGMKQLKEIHDNTLSIFLLSSYEEIVKRLGKRGDNTELAEGRINNYKKEANDAKNYDIVIEVDGLTVEEVSKKVLDKVQERLE